MCSFINRCVNKPICIYVNHYKSIYIFSQCCSWGIETASCSTHSQKFLRNESFPESTCYCALVDRATEPRMRFLPFLRKRKQVVSWPLLISLGVALVCDHIWHHNHHMATYGRSKRIPIEIHLFLFSMNIINQKNHSQTQAAA